MLLQGTTLTDWLTQFSALHVRAKLGELSVEERATYLRSRDELAEAMLLAQRLTQKPGEVARRALRVALALSVDLDLPSGRVSALTLDLSTGGFSALVPQAAENGRVVAFVIKLGRAAAPVPGRGKVVSVVLQPGSARLGVMFEELAAADRERLEFVIVDAILRQFGVRPGAKPGQTR